MSVVEHTLRPVSENEGQFFLPFILSQGGDRVVRNDGEFRPVAVTHVSHFPRLDETGSVEFGVAVAYGKDDVEGKVGGFTRISKIRLHQNLTSPSSPKSQS